MSSCLDYRQGCLDMNSYMFQTRHSWSVYDDQSVYDDHWIDGELVLVNLEKGESNQIFHSDPGNS